jgi:hypothetical protein
MKFKPYTTLDGTAVGKFSDGPTTGIRLTTKMGLVMN